MSWQSRAIRVPSDTREASMARDLLRGHNKLSVKTGLNPEGNDSESPKYKLV